MNNENNPVCNFFDLLPPGEEGQGTNIKLQPYTTEEVEEMQELAKASARKAKKYGTSRTFDFLPQAGPLHVAANDDELAREVVLRSYGYTHGGYCDVRIHENGWELLCDTTQGDQGYLHVTDSCPERVSARVCESMILYFYQHGSDMPGLGATPQTRYLHDYSIDEREAIGNSGHRSIYA